LAQAGVDLLIISKLLGHVGMRVALSVKKAA